MFDILYPLSQQTLKDFEICVSHQGDQTRILRALNDYWDILNITFKKAEEGNISVNTNNAMKMGEGDIIKVLYSDDLRLVDSYSFNINLPLIFSDLIAIVFSFCVILEFKMNYSIFHSKQSVFVY